MTTIIEGQDEILSIFKTDWDSNSLSSDVKVFYPDDEEKESDKDASQPWARIHIKHFDGGFSGQSLSDSTGLKKFERDGVVMINIFTPIGKGSNLKYQLASIAINAYEGKSTPNGVWFRNVRFNEVGVSGAWFNTVIKANFNYAEIK